MPLNDASGIFNAGNSCIEALRICFILFGTTRWKSGAPQSASCCNLAQQAPRKRRRCSQLAVTTWVSGRRPLTGEEVVQDGALRLPMCHVS